MAAEGEGREGSEVRQDKRRRNCRREQTAEAAAAGIAHGRCLAGESRPGNGQRSQLHPPPRKTGIGFLSLRAFWRMGSK